jgi:hypothetical protein
MRTRELLTLLVLVVLAISACGSEDSVSEPAPDPQTLLAEGVSQLQNASSFRYEIDVSGYPVDVPIEGLDLPEDAGVSFKYASGEFKVPDRLSARVQFRLGVLSTTADLIIVDDEQYFRGELLTGNRWLKAELIPGFSPAVLMAQPGGIAHTLSTLTDLVLVGRRDLDGQSAYQLRGRVDAGRVFSLTLGLSRTSSGLLDIEVYVGVRDRRVARITLVEPPPEWAADAEPTTWLINISDYNVPLNIEAPVVGEGG